MKRPVQDAANDAANVATNVAANDAAHDAADAAPDNVAVPTADANVGAPEPYNDELRKALQERDHLHDRWMRTAADLENFRKRSQKELAEQRSQATLEAVRAFLPVLDGFERALTHADHADVPPAVRQGIELLQRQMQDALRRLGVEPVETENERFDPHLHEAVEMVETDEVADHAIVGEVQRGYRLRDRLIRPAMVKVARRP